MSYYTRFYRSTDTDKWVNVHKVKDLTIKTEDGKVVVTKANGVTFVCNAGKWEVQK